MASEEHLSTRPDDGARETGATGVPAELLDILVCPVDHGALEPVSDGLRCTVCKHLYPVEGGIPNMVVGGD
jgi:hypothetical protein